MMEALRLKKLRERMKQSGLEALLITNDYNRRYMTGFTGSSGMAVVTGEHAVLLTDFRYMTQAPQQVKAFAVKEHQPDPFVTVSELMSEWGVSSIGFEQQHVSYGTYLALKDKMKGIELVATDGIVDNIRLIKDEDELAILREAAELADRTYAHLLNFLKPGLSENDVALEIEFFVRTNGASATSFDTIVASGERSALPHGKAEERILQAGEFVKMDYGAYYKGYCSDITRTVVLGKPLDKHREIYDIVLEAQLCALERIRPGMTGKEADALARDVIARHGYGDRFGHGLGHGIGLEIHEGPRLSPIGNAVLEPGMVVTVEPGIYLPGFGGVRIEDDIVVTERGIEVITKADKTFTVIS